MLLVNIYVSKPFARLAAHQELTDSRLCRSVDEMNEGLTGSNLGSGLFKKRIPMSGQGKRGGWRVLLGFQKGKKPGPAAIKLLNLVDRKGIEAVA